MDIFKTVLDISKDTELNYSNLAYKFSQLFVQTTNGDNSKFLKIHRKIMTSSKVSNLIYKSSKGSFAPTANEYLGGLHSIPFFIFSKPETIALAGLISLERWNQEVNIKRQLVDDGDLKNTLVQILRQSSNLKMY